jgi:GNAT superfamily N-acetyltransferase
VSATTAAELPDTGSWVPVTDTRVPDWLRPFGGDALVAFDDDGSYLAGVGLKRHDRFGHEIAVGTDERARGRGLARRLVAQASRELLGRGVVPTYLHDRANAASARVADAAGLPDRGWGALGIAPLPA